MTDYTSLPSSVLAKIATLDAHCVGLTNRLERARQDLKRLRIEQRDLAPRNRSRRVRGQPRDPNG